MFAIDQSNLFFQPLSPVKKPVQQVVRQDPQADQVEIRFGARTVGTTTEMHNAAKSGNLARIDQLLSWHAESVHIPDEQGRTPLHLAAEAGRVDVIKRFLHYNADVNRQSHSGATPLRGAAENGHLRVVELLLQQGKARPDVPDNAGRTPLYMVAGHRLPNPYRDSVRQIDAQKQDDQAIVSLLLDAGAEVNRRTNNGRTALHEAARFGRVDIIEMLLEKGANANLIADDELGASPLQEALLSGFNMSWGSFKAANKLIQAGADVHHRDKFGNTPLMTLIQEDNDIPLDLDFEEQVLETANLLLEKGASPKAIIYEPGVQDYVNALLAMGEAAQAVLDGTRTREDVLREATRDWLGHVNDHLIAMGLQQAEKTAEVYRALKARGAVSDGTGLNNGLSQRLQQMFAMLSPEDVVQSFEDFVDSPIVRAQRYGYRRLEALLTEAAAKV